MTTMASTTTMPTVARRGRGRDARARGAAMGCAHRRRVVTLAGGKRGDDGEEKAQDVDERRGMDWDGAWRAFRGCVVSFIGSPTMSCGDGAEDEVVHSLGLSVRARGGTLCDAPTRDGCTHVVLMDGVDATVVETVLPASARVVTARWLRETLEAGTVACA